MSNLVVSVAKFAKDHIPLVCCTLGIAILGFLGYRVVIWILSKCGTTAKVDQVAQKSLINLATNIPMSSDKISAGQGEYIVFHSLPNGEKKEVSRETFEHVYKILLQYSPEALMKTCSQRYALITEKIKEVDPTLEAIFVPRTLYELVFIRKCIKEDLKHKKICSQLTPILHDTAQMRKFLNDEVKYKEYLKSQEEERSRRKCWHLCYFTDAGDNNHAGVKDVAYRLNKVIFKELNPSKDGFTYQEFSPFVENEITFLKTHHKNMLEIVESAGQGKKCEEDITSCTTPGPTTNFGVESTRGSIKPMGIRNESDAQIIRNALALDCSKIAQYSFLLYRGGDFQKDSSCTSDNEKPYSLSYGTSLFAGCLYDGGATAFHYMRKEKNAYAIPVPFDQLYTSPFYIPTTHTAAQVFGDGEIFHARTKAWKSFDVTQISGMNGGAHGNLREHLKSTLSKEEITAQFQEYKRTALQLK